MGNKRRKFSASFKSKVAIEAIKEHSIIQELAKKQRWKIELRLLK